ncbi:MAG: ABC transporter ATP-binding protein [Bacillota bacterium]
MSVVKRLLNFTFRYWGRILLGAVAMLAGIGLQLAVPTLIRGVIDVALNPRGPRPELLGWFALGVVAIHILRGGTSYLERFSMEYMAQRVIYDIRNAIYNRLQQLSFSFYDQAQTGQLMSRATADVETLRRFLGFGILALLRNLVTFVGVFAYLLALNWRLTLVAMATMPLLIHAVTLFGRRVRPTFLAVREQLAQLTSVLQENVTGVRVVRAFAQEDYEEAKFRRENQAFLETNLNSIRLWAYYFPYMNFLSGLAAALVLWYGGREVILGRLSLGGLVAFNALVMQLIGPLRMIGWLSNLYNRAATSGSRVFELLETEPEIKDSPDAVEMPPIAGRVVFENVSFAYPTDPENLVLRDINLTAEPGQTIALLGATGSGKTSITNLVPRFYDPSAGRVTVDGIDIRTVTLNSLRRQIGIVLQETFLFSASIGENIAYGRAGATNEEIIAAAKAAHIHDFIMSLPKQYETVVGERGVGLSGGQKQRVAIARALLMDPRLLILDDSTSSVDTETEYQIQQALANLMRGRTTFVIAQRLSTIKNADQIVVLEDGEIVEQGTHAELLETGRIYRQIYEMQLRPQDQTETATRAVAEGSDA